MDSYFGENLRDAWRSIRQVFSTDGYQVAHKVYEKKKNWVLMLGEIRKHTRKSILFLPQGRNWSYWLIRDRCVIVPDKGEYVYVIMPQFLARKWRH